MCKQIKPLDEFYKDKNRKCGRRSRCKLCQLKKSREYKSRPEVKKRSAELMAKRRLENPGYHRYLTYRRSHVRKKSVLNQSKFNLTFEEFLEIVKQPCFYCGDTTSNGIDRVDNNKGYISGNMVSCCKVCNFGKRDMNKEKFFEWIKKVYNYSLSVPIK